MVLRLDIDEGSSGDGEMMLLPIGFRWPVVSAMIDDLVDQALVGHDPYNAEELFDRIYGRAGYSHVPELTNVAILSAFDIACWDIVGKHLGQPVHRLLGGRVRDRLRTYTYLCAAPSHADLGRSLRRLWLARRLRHPFRPTRSRTRPPRGRCSHPPPRQPRAEPDSQLLTVVTSTG
jgi:L-alanine-DL-glutamate epimerase-like enolase superfamily enzyme